MPRAVLGVQYSITRICALCSMWVGAQAVEGLADESVHMGVAMALCEMEVQQTPHIPFFRHPETDSSRSIFKTS